MLHRAPQGNLRYRVLLMCVLPYVLQAPFRFPRVFLFWAVAVGSAAGLVIITGRLVLALQGGEGAPDLTESVTNFAINSTVLALVSVLLYRESKAKAKSVEVTDREELLSRLQVRVCATKCLAHWAALYSMLMHAFDPYTAPGQRSTWGAAVYCPYSSSGASCGR